MLSLPESRLLRLFGYIQLYRPEHLQHAPISTILFAGFAS